MKTIQPIILSFFLIFPLSKNIASETDSIVIDGMARDYLLHVPESYNGSFSAALLIGLHYLGSTGSQFETMSKFSQLSDRHGFIAAYPNGIGNSWNAGNCCDPAVDQDIDDIEFISQLIDTLSKNYNIDSTRIYVAGFSNGSIMAYRIANELSDKITSIGCVSGQAFQDTINPSGSVPIIHFHALDDQAVKFEGDTSATLPYKSVLEVLNTWKDINDCENDSVIIRDEDNIRGYLWSSPGDDINMVLYTSNTGGHSWTMNPRLGISNLIWEFFTTGKTNVPVKYDTLVIDTIKRSYKTHLPNKYYTDVTGEQKYPLILAFHGWDQNADLMEEYTGMSNKANRENFIVSYLDYVGPPPDFSWNYFINDDKPNDIGFVNKVLDTLISAYPVDTFRIYAIGFSDGCGMANRLPFELQGTIKGIGTVSGMIAFDDTVDTYKVPLIHINNTGDFAWSGIQSKIPYWIELNDCNNTVDTTVNARGVVGKRWVNDDGVNHVVLISSPGGSHAWVETEYVNATNLIWEFFETGNAIPDVDTPLIVKPSQLLENNDFVIFPNPADEFLFIKTNLSDFSNLFVSIYDSSGRLLSDVTTELKSVGMIRIDVSHFTAGVYYLQIINSNRTYCAKVIVT